MSIIWVPGHLSIHGNEHADELAGIVGVLKTLGPEPPPPIAESVSGTQRSGLLLNQRREVARKLNQMKNLYQGENHQEIPLIPYS